MQIIASGQHISVSLPVQEYVKDKLEGLIEKYKTHLIDARVHFSKHGNKDIACDIIAHDAHAHESILKSKGISHEMRDAFDDSFVKFEHQIRKLKSKLNDHHKKV